MTVHALDRDLLLADHTSTSTLGQSETKSICCVKVGLLQECLFWASGKEHNVEEISCRAKGDQACEFKIIVGGEA